MKNFDKIITKLNEMSNEEKLEVINYLIVKEKDDITISRFCGDDELTDKLMKQLDVLNQLKTTIMKILKKDLAVSE